MFELLMLTAIALAVFSQFLPEGKGGCGEPGTIDPEEPDRPDWLENRCYQSSNFHCSKTPAPLQKISARARVTKYK